jgi:hypothetical protein
MGSKMGCPPRGIDVALAKVVAMTEISCSDDALQPAMEERSPGIQVCPNSGYQRSCLKAP